MRYNSILFQIKTLDKVIFRKLFSEVELDKEKLCRFQKPTPTQMEIIHYILENSDKDIFQKDLENVLNLRRATVSGVLQTMEKNNLIERVTDTEDTRTKKIILNKKTKEIFLRNKEKMDAIENIMIKGISKSDLENFTKVIEIMKSNIENIDNK